MHRIVACVVLAWILAFVAPAGLAAEPAAAFAPGQMWTINNSPVKVVVVRVEPWHDRTAVHVSVVDLPASGNQKSLDHIDYMPFDGEALAASIGTLIAVDAKPETGFEQGYADWQADHGDLFTISVSAVIATLYAKTHRGNPH